jgi:hypothetical protein
VKFISSQPGSGHTMTYAMKLPRDPKAAPTANGSVVDYAQLSPAPWFGLPICDPKSYPQNPCTPDSDTNSGTITDPNAAGSAFTFHAEYSTARQQNQVPWAALEAGVLMQQEIGHGEACNSVTNQLPAVNPSGGTGYTDPQAFQTCVGGSERPNATGEGPCTPTGCQNATTFQYIGPFTKSGHTYPLVQFETDAAGSENLCNITTGVGCTAPPIGAKFYPFWSLSPLSGGMGGHSAGCVWNFGNDQPNTLLDFGRDAQYGAPNLARYGGTLISAPAPNPQFTGRCRG